MILKELYYYKNPWVNLSYTHEVPIPCLLGIMALAHFFLVNQIIMLLQWMEGEEGGRGRKLPNIFTDLYQGCYPNFQAALKVYCIDY